jgi:hypothetical protein
MGGTESRAVTKETEVVVTEHKEPVKRKRERHRNKTVTTTYEETEHKPEISSDKPKTKKHVEFDSCPPSQVNSAPKKTEKPKPSMPKESWEQTIQRLIREERMPNPANAEYCGRAIPIQPSSVNRADWDMSEFGMPVYVQLSGLGGGHVVATRNENNIKWCAVVFFDSKTKIGESPSKYRTEYGQIKWGIPWKVLSTFVSNVDAIVSDGLMKGDEGDDRIHLLIREQTKQNASMIRPKKFSMKYVEFTSDTSEAITTALRYFYADTKKSDDFIFYNTTPQLEQPKPSTVSETIKQQEEKKEELPKPTPGSTAVEQKTVVIKPEPGETEKTGQGTQSLHENGVGALFTF